MSKTSPVTVGWGTSTFQHHAVEARNERPVPPEAALGRRVQQPPDETVELGTPGNVYAAAYRRRAACFASPSRAPRAGGAVLDQLGATYTAPGVIPRNLHRTCSQSMFNPASHLAVAHEISHSIHTFLPITPIRCSFDDMCYTLASLDHEFLQKRMCVTPRRAWYHDHGMALERRLGTVE